MCIYSRIKKIAQKKDLPISKIERATDLSNGTIRRWNGAVSPSTDNLLRVANYLNVTVDSLLKDDAEKE